MCSGGSKPKPPPPPPPPQPPALVDVAPEVQVGNKSEESSKRRKVGRSQLRSASASSPSSKSGLGS